MGEISGSINEASPTTEVRTSGIHLMAVLCTAAESCVTGKKENKLVRDRGQRVRINSIV